jgi:nitrite reductase/ring-hydroxylating ferredoxin subunit
MIPNQWYAIMESRRLKRKPIGLTRLGQRFVLWRDMAGQPVCMEDRCAHRGVALSIGRVCQDTIECRYHGLRYNQRGECVAIPALGESAAIPKSLRVSTHHVREEAGFVWLYWGEPGKEPPQVPWIEEVPRQSRSVITRGEVWPFNYVRILENNLDANHWAFLHGDIMVGIGEFFEEYNVETEGDLIRTSGLLKRTNRRTGRRVAPWPFKIHHKMPNLSMIEVTSRFRSLVIVTPIDESSSWVAIRCYQTYARLPVFRFLINHYCLNFLYAVPQYLQDFPVFQVQTPRYSGIGVNRLLPPEKGIAEYLLMRRRMLKEAGIENDRSDHCIENALRGGSNGAACSQNGSSQVAAPRALSASDRRSYERTRDLGTEGPLRRGMSWMFACLGFPLLVPSICASHAINFLSGRHLATPAKPRTRQPMTVDAELDTVSK